MTIDVTLEPIASTSELERDWRDLEVRSDASYGQSWDWIGTWFDVVPPHELSCLVARDGGGSIVGLGLAGSARRWMGPMRVPTLDLQETAGCLGTIGLGHGPFLADRNHESAVREALVRFLADGVSRGRWRQVSFGWVPGAYTDAPLPDGVVAVPRWREPDHYVDLDDVRACGDYSALLGHKTRRNLRRSRRNYERRIGTLRFEVAASVDEAQAHFVRLVDLHQSLWRSRGWPGNFAQPEVVEFYRTLLERRFEAKEIQLCRITAGDHEVGYLCLLVYRDRVLLDTMGLSYEERGVFQPGRVANWLAIEWCASMGHAVYDFLVGDIQFKRSMGTDRDWQTWMLLRRDRAADRWEEKIRKVLVGAVMGGPIHRLERKVRTTLERRRR